MKKPRRAGFISTIGRHTPESLGRDLDWDRISKKHKNLKDAIFSNAEILENHEVLTKLGIKC